MKKEKVKRSPPLLTRVSNVVNDVHMKTSNRKGSFKENICVCSSRVLAMMEKKLQP